jgi:hypothetical protein
MISTRRISREELEKRLQPYRCKMIRAFQNFELWETGWGTAFTLWPEDGMFDEWQYAKLVTTLINTTMPANWNPKNGNGK